MLSQVYLTIITLKSECARQVGGGMGLVLRGSIYSWCINKLDVVSLSITTCNPFLAMKNTWAHTVHINEKQTLSRQTTPVASLRYYSMTKVFAQHSTEDHFIRTTKWNIWSNVCCYKPAKREGVLWADRIYLKQKNTHISNHSIGCPISLSLSLLSLAPFKYNAHTQIRRDLGGVGVEEIEEFGIELGLREEWRGRIDVIGPEGGWLYSHILLKAWLNEWTLFISGSQPTQHWGKCYYAQG